MVSVDITTIFKWGLIMFIIVIIVFHNFETINRQQHPKKVVSDRPGLVDFTVRLVNFFLKLPIGKVNFGVEFKLYKNCKQSRSSKSFCGLLEMTFGLVHVSYMQLVRTASC